MSLPKQPLRNSVELLLELVHKEIRLRYKNTILGYVWSILNPLLLATVFYVAFSIIMRIRIENYAFLLVAGLFPWQWFANSTQASSNIYIWNAVLIKKVRFHRALLPLATIINDLLHFAVTIPVIVLVGLKFGKLPSVTLLWGLPLVLLAQLGVCYGVGLLVSALNPFFRDVERLVSVALLVLFYATPVVYPASLIPEEYLPFFALNPMANVTMVYHGLFLEGTMLWSNLGLAWLGAAVLLAVGGGVHSRLQWRLAEVL